MRISPEGGVTVPPVVDVDAVVPDVVMEVVEEVATVPDVSAVEAVDAVVTDVIPAVPAVVAVVAVVAPVCTVTEVTLVAAVLPCVVAAAEEDCVVFLGEHEQISAAHTRTEKSEIILFFIISPCYNFQKPHQRCGFCLFLLYYFAN